MSESLEVKGARTGSRPKSRRRAREYVVQALYAWLLNAPKGIGELGVIEAHVRDDAEFEQADAEWFESIWRGVTAQDEAESLRELFMPYVDRSLHEMSPVEHAILLLGTYELVHAQEVPYRVAINESVELAKSFGATDGFKFINGVLDKVAAQVREPEIRRKR
ncbi:transcription antitermination factor NusB [Orrella sp. 11846]|uniref:transcription antitermination factor NusB n=1 Tax=Orrella sp. 11846 TaxID=3409913 RepID=UPI003B58BC73